MLFESPVMFSSALGKHEVPRTLLGGFGCHFETFKRHFGRHEDHFEDHLGLQAALSNI